MSVSKPTAARTPFTVISRSRRHAHFPSPPHGLLLELRRVLSLRYLLHFVSSQSSILSIDPWKTKFEGQIRSLPAQHGHSIAAAL